MLGICILGRMGGTVGLIGLLRLCGYDSGIKWKEVFFIGYAGLIRGAIAFGLVLRIDGSQVDSRSVIVTTCLTLVVFTTVFFGATVGSMQAFLFPKEEKVAANDDDTQQSILSEHSDALHPNEELEEADEGGSHKSRRKLGCCLKTWVKLDEWILRDLLIYNYKIENRKSQQMFFDMYERDGEEVANIIKDAAKEEESNNDESKNSAQLKDRVKAIQRRPTVKIEDVNLLAINEANDDKFFKQTTDEI